MDELGTGVWLHPFRTPATPGSPPDTAPFLLWQVFGWTFDTTITISRLIFAVIYDRHPDLKLILTTEEVSSRTSPDGWGMMPAFGDLDPSGSLREALERLKKKPIEYFRMLYGRRAESSAAVGDMVAGAIKISSPRSLLRRLVPGSSERVQPAVRSCRGCPCRKRSTLDPERSCSAGGWGESLHR
jgi:hypothetical protein